MNQLKELTKEYFLSLCQRQEEYSKSNLSVHPRPKVSVSVVTYNQKNFIAKCLEAFVNQITNFPYEIIIGEDGSTDGTREICIEFLKGEKFIFVLYNKGCSLKIEYFK